LIALLGTGGIKTINVISVRPVQKKRKITLKMDSVGVLNVVNGNPLQKNISTPEKTRLPRSVSNAFPIGIPVNHQANSPEKVIFFVLNAAENSLRIPIIFIGDQQILAVLCLSARSVSDTSSRMIVANMS